MLTIHVCVGSACHIKGSYGVINLLQSIIEKKKLGGQVTVKAALCLGKCGEGISVRINDGEVISINEKNINGFFDEIIMNKL